MIIVLGRFFRPFFVRFVTDESCSKDCNFLFLYL